MIKREAQQCKMKLKIQEARVDPKYMLRFKNTRKLADSSFFFRIHFAAGCTLFAKLWTKDFFHDRTFSIAIIVIVVS